VLEYLYLFDYIFYSDQKVTSSWTRKLWGSPY